MRIPETSFPAPAGRAAIAAAALLLAACEPPAPGDGWSAAGAGAPRWGQTRGPAGGTDVRALHVRGEELLVASDEGSWLSPDGGARWVAVAGLPPGSATALADAGAALLVALDHDALHRSVDGGRTFTEASALGSTIALAAHAGAAYAVMAGEDGRVPAKSSDGGATWRRLAELPGGDRPHRIFAGAVGLLASSVTTGALYRSVDDGASWRRLPAPPAIARADAFGEWAGALFAASQAERRIWRSSDAGASWSTFALAGAAGAFGRSYFAATRHGFYAAFGWGDVLRFDDEAGAWAPARDGLPAGFVGGFAGGEAGLFASVDDVVHRFDPAAGSWRPLADAPVRTSVPHLAAAPDGLLAIDAHGRAHAADPGGLLWTRLAPGRRFVAIAHDGGSTIWAGSAGGGIVRSDDRGATWIASRQGWPRYEGTQGPRDREVGGLAFADGVVFASTGIGLERTGWAGEVLSMTGAGVFRLRDGAWEAARAGLPVLGTGGDGAPVYEPIPTLFHLGGSLFAGCAFSGLFRSDDGGESWSPAGGGLPAGSPGGPRPVQDLVEAGGVLYARVDGRVFSSRDGSSWRELPSLPDAAAIASDGTTLFVGLRGVPMVLATDDGGATLVPFGAGDPGAPPLDLAVRGCALFAATAGSGVWRAAPGAGCGYMH